MDLVTLHSLWLEEASRAEAAGLFKQAAMAHSRRLASAGESCPEIREQILDDCVRCEAELVSRGEFNMTAEPTEYDSQSWRDVLKRCGIHPGMTGNETTVAPQTAVTSAQPPYAPPPASRRRIETPPAADNTGFVTAQQQLQADIRAGKTAAPPPRLGLRRAAVPPLYDNSAPQVGNAVSVDAVTASVTKAARNGPEESQDDIPDSLKNPDGSVPDKLANLDPKLVSQIASEILELSCNVTWDDIAGLANAKAEVEEAIVWPLTRPDLFYGLRDPPRGLLLFGPPGTGKTMIARAIASRGSCTFMNVSSSSLMSKWVGDGEKMVRCMFAVAAVKQPTVIFIDEIDSLLSMRSEGEMDAVRRIKTEFLVQFDGVGSNSSDRILIIGATNRPEELDEAARRRMEKRLYIPLPDRDTRLVLVTRLLSKFANDLTNEDFQYIADRTEGYSGADVKLLARDASMGPLRDQSGSIVSVAARDIRPIARRDFISALRRVKPSVAPKEVERYETFNAQFGSFSGATFEDDHFDA
jgi:SpoVK/Ycf46/Vps4 family AAA+-type ATPase